MKTKKSLPYPLLAFILALICWILFLAAYGALGYGNYTILRGDLFAQYIDFISMFLRVLKGEESFWYSFSIYYGAGSVLTHAYYCLSPFNLLYLLDFISIPAMTSIIIGLKFSLAAASFAFFSERVLKRRDIFVLLFSVFYAFNSFSITFYINMIWLDSLFMLPILVWLLFELVDRKKYLLMTLVWFYLFMTNFYMAYMLGIFAALAFIGLLIHRIDKWDKNAVRFIISRILRFAGAVILAAGMSAVILLPSAVYILSHLASDNFAFNDLKTSVLDIVNTLFIGSMPYVDNDVPLLYCGIPTLLMVPAYFICRKFSVKEKIITWSLILFLMIGMLWLPLFIAMHAFDYPNWYAFRFSYILSFLLCACALRGTDRETVHSRKAVYVRAAALIVFYSFMTGFWPLTASSHDITSNSATFAVNAAFILLWSLFLTRDTGTGVSIRRVRTINIIIAVLIVAEICVNSYICVSHIGGTPLSEHEYNQWYYPEKEAVNSIKENDKGFYRISAPHEYSSNAASCFGYAGLNTFSTSDLYDLRSALHDLGICTVNRAIEEYGYTDITKMLFACKYTMNLTLYDEEKQTAVTRDNAVPADISTYPYALPLGYMVSSKINDYSPTDDPFSNQEQLVSLMAGESFSFFTPIAESELVQEGLNTRLQLNDNYHIFSRYTHMIPGAYKSFAAPETDGRIFYACFVQKKAEARLASAYVISDTSTYWETPILSYGCIHRGTAQPELFSPEYKCVSVYLHEDVSSGDYCDNAYFVYYDSSHLEAAYSALSSDPFIIKEWKSDKINGTVTATEERDLLFTSIPYDKGWKVRIDGIDAVPVTCLNDAFIALRLNPGTHEICFTYEAPGMKTGTVISVFSFLILLILSAVSIINCFSKRRTSDNGQYHNYYNAES